MIDHWEMYLIGFACGVFTVYGLSYVLLLGMGVPREPKKPIYGPADPYRRDGQQPRPNLRMVRP